MEMLNHKFIDTIAKENRAGFGFIPFVGSGLSVASGIITAQHFESFLAHTVCLCCSKNWNLRRDGWPPYPTREQDLEARKWIGLRLAELCQDISLSDEAFSISGSGFAQGYGRDAAPTPQELIRVAVTELDLSARKPQTHVVAGIRRELRAIDPEQPIANINPLETIIGNSIAPQRLAAAFVSVFAVIALVLGVVGLYSVMLFHMAEREAEIAMRLALGADRRHIVRLVLRRTSRLVALGGLIGSAFVLSATHSVGGFIAGANQLDARTLVVSVLAFLAVGFGAALLPAFRVTRADQSLVSRFC